jgi:multicomponent Na+:H+ antiporter subunit F
MIRLIRGPTAGDRILALDMLTLLAIGVVAAFAVRTGQYLYLDLSVALALVGLLGTAAFARYLAHRSES